MGPELIGYPGARIVRDRRQESRLVLGQSEDWPKVFAKFSYRLYPHPGWRQDYPTMAVTRARYEWHAGISMRQ